MPIFAPRGSAFVQPGESGTRSGLLIIAVLLAVAFSAAFPSFGTWSNATSIAVNAAALGIAALGTACLLITGHIDLSIGSLTSLVGVVVAKTAVLTGSGSAAVVVGLSVGAAAGLANGALVQGLAISPIIVTVATMIIGGGLAFLVTDGDTVGGLPSSLVAFGRSHLGPIPTPVAALLALFLAVAYVLTRTRLGLRLYAVGGNRAAARLAGVPVDRLVLMTFSGNGLLVAIAAVLTTARLGIGSPIAGTGFEFGVLTATILGGVSFAGGSGRPLGILYGIAATGILNAGLVFLGLPFFIQDTARGVLLLVALAVDQMLQRRATRARRPSGPGPTHDAERPSPPASRVLHDGPAPPRGPPLLAAAGLHKRFGAVVALDGVDVVVHAGEVLCLIGDNGAGKSTLIKILSGALAADAGVLAVNGTAVEEPTPRRMRQRGIETVYQDLALCPNLGAAHNLTLGEEPTTTWFGLLPARDDVRARRIATERLTALGVQLPSTDRPVSTLSGGQRQAVAISRAMHPGITVAILDEPTAALGVQQTESVLAMIHSVAARGAAVILISHDVRTVRAAATRIIVLRRGRITAERHAADLEDVELLRLMAGADGWAATSPDERPG